MSAAWLPALVEFDGDWNNLNAYVDTAYAVFARDFLERAPPMLGKCRVSLRRHPEFDGKSSGFWHLVTEGRVEENRYPVVERCERIAWVRAVLERAPDSKKDVLTWKNTRGADERLLLALPDFSYVIVLQERGDKTAGTRYYLLLTAYPVAEGHGRQKLRREYEAWVASRTKG